MLIGSQKMKKGNNKFVQHLLKFGKMIKAKGINLDIENQQAYMLHTNDYDYSFRTTNYHGLDIHSILVVKNLDNEKKRFIPLIMLSFTNDGHMELMSPDELTEQAIGMGFNTSGERYYGEW